jgi:radical SAM-linked protein
MRLRITFTKKGAAKYSGHLDLHKTWERMLRRAGLPLAYSNGFHPQPKLHLGAALPVGMTSRCEVADVWLNTDLPTAKILADLQAATAPGLEILTVEQVADSLPPLQTQLLSADYTATLPATPIDLSGKVAALLAASTLPRERRGKAYDLRPLVESLSLDGSSLHMRLAARDGATGRPEEVLAALGLTDPLIAVERVALYFVS